MRFSTLSDWLAWLESFHPAAIELGLERIAAVAGRLHIDLSAGRVVTVAGTNGKGSCVAALDALCRAAGLEAGCYTSPHFLHYNERVRVRGRPVSDAQLMAAFERVYAALAGVTLTYFEFGTLAALDIFQREALDVVLLEVGLGGRLDAVNVVDADIGVVTSVALDHEAWLGRDRNAIGFEKAGIFRPGRPAVCADVDPPESVVRQARAIAADLMVRGRDYGLVEAGSGALQWWSGGNIGEVHTVPGMERLKLPIASVAAALQVAELLGIPQGHWDCLSGLSLPGRYQRVCYNGRQLVLDVAHNPEAAAMLARRLRGQPVAGRRYALIAAMADKDIDNIVEPLKACFDQWWVASLPGVARAAATADLAETVGARVAAPVEAVDNVVNAFGVALARMTAADQLVVFGSFYTVAAVMDACGMVVDRVENDASPILQE